MAGDGIDTGEEYSSMLGLLYVFNLIVGTGAIAMPAPIAESGWLLSLIILCILAIMSFVTVTFVTESMAAANAVLLFRKNELLKKLIKKEDSNAVIDKAGEQISEQVSYDEVIGDSVKNVPLLIASVDAISETTTEYFNITEITERVEMGKMAMLFFNKIGVNLFYFFIIVYLYGDLAIYAAAVSKSLRDVTCIYTPIGACSLFINNSVACWGTDIQVTREDAYRIYLLAFLLLLGPFTFFNIHKTKYLQIFTTLMRWLAFSTMIILAARTLINGKGKGHPPAASISGVPNLFGVCVYSFMCHHSLPSLITPIREKSRIFRLFVIDYTLILIFYCLLSFTGIFAFHRIKDAYTLNFEPQDCNSSSSSNENIVPESLYFIQYFLSLFPVFTLSTSFPIISITLRNNLKAMCLRDDRKYSFFVQRLLFPLLAVIPPVAIAFITEDLTILVGITGSYAGAAIQYFIPAFLAFYSRKHISSLGVRVTNKHASPFRHVYWIYFVLFWAVMCIIFVTADHVIELK